MMTALAIQSHNESVRQFLLKTTVAAVVVFDCEQKESLRGLCNLLLTVSNSEWTVVELKMTERAHAFFGSIPVNI